MVGDSTDVSALYSTACTYSAFTDLLGNCGSGTAAGLGGGGGGSGTRINLHSIGGSSTIPVSPTVPGVSTVNNQVVPMPTVPGTTGGGTTGGGTPNPATRLLHHPLVHTTVRVPVHVPVVPYPGIRYLVAHQACKHVNANVLYTY